MSVFVQVICTPIVFRSLIDALAGVSVAYSPIQIKEKLAMLDLQLSYSNNKFNSPEAEQRRVQQFRCIQARVEWA